MWSKEYQKYSAIRKMELLLLFIYIIIVILYCMEGAEIICSFIDSQRIANIQSVLLRAYSKITLQHE